METDSNCLREGRKKRLADLRQLLRRRNLVMGILNVTPDSFSDGGRFLKTSEAIDQALRMEEEGADLIDIGGESSRPGADPVSLEEELDRVIPVIQGVRQRSGLPISVDTYKPGVAEQALDSGADIVNDISAMEVSDQMGSVVGQHGGGLILMHMRGKPKTMQSDTSYRDLLVETRDFLGRKIREAVAHGIQLEDVWIDPGIGFGKSPEGNLEILANLSEYDTLGAPLVVGLSRKSFIGKIIGGNPDERLYGTVGLTGAIARDGVHRIHRVHDVGQAVDCLRSVEALNGKDVT